MFHRFLVFFEASRKFEESGAVFYDCWDGRLGLLTSNEARNSSIGGGWLPKSALWLMLADLNDHPNNRQKLHRIPQGVSVFYRTSRVQRSLSSEFWAIITSKLLKNHIRPSGICFPKQKIQYRKIRIVAPFTQSHAEIVIRVISGKRNANFQLRALFDVSKPRRPSQQS